MSDRVQHPFEVLEGHQYMSLTTFRKSGEAVPTPVWFALVGGRVYVFTGLHSGKVKRIRNYPEVEIAPCGPRGGLLGDRVRAAARLMDEGESGIADRALREKYGWLYRAYQVGTRPLSKKLSEHVFLEIRPETE